MVLGLINNDDEAAYLEEVERLTSWCQDNCLSLNVSKTKELIMDFRKRQQWPYTPLMISGTPVERVSSFKYLGVNISEDLTWTTHIQTQVKKARQRLYHLRQLRKFRVSPAILKNLYSGAIESVLTQCISVWYGNSSNQDCKALQRVVRLAERISGSALPSLQVIYLKRCKSRAAKIIKDSNHPGNHLFHLLPSGKRFRSMMAKTERLRRSFFPQAIRLLNTNSVSQKKKKKKKKKLIFIFSSSVLLLCLHSQYKPVCTSFSSLLFILLFIKSHILFLHIYLFLHILFCTFLYSITLFTLYFSFLPIYIYIYALVWCYFYIIFILCTVH